MITTVERLSSNRVKISFEVEPERFEAGMAAAYRKIVKRLNIQGFRKGKAPRKVVEMHYGESVFYEDAIDYVFPSAYREAIAEHSIKPVDQPEFELTSVGKGEPLLFDVTVYVSPEVRLGEYRGLKVARHATGITEDDVKAEIERARDGAATYSEVADRPVRLGDRVSIDYKGYIGGEPFEGGEESGRGVTIGDGALIPGFEDQLIGASAGGEVKVEVTFPEDYHAEALKGKPAAFDVKINSITEKELPALDDEFAKDVSECETYDEYAASVRERLEKAAAERDDREFESRAIEEAAKDAEADIPERMVEDRLDDRMREFKMRLIYQGMDPARYFEYVGQAEDGVREEMRADARDDVMARLTLEAIAEAEGLEPTEDEVRAEAEAYARRIGKDAEAHYAEMSEDERKYLTEDARIKKAVGLIKAEAVEPEAEPDAAEPAPKPKRARKAAKKPEAGDVGGAGGEGAAE